MMPTPLRAAPFLLAILVSALLVLSAPFVGQMRSVVRREFPGQFVMIVGGVVACGVALALGAAVWRIRDRRLARYGAIALALLIAVGYSAANATEFPESNAVERFHFLQYGLITFLFYRAWRPLADPSVLLLPICAGLIVGTAEEWLQWFIPNRVGEMRDVALNLVALVSGLLFSLGLSPPGGMRAVIAPSSRRRIVRMGIAALVSFAAFFHVVHLGFEVHDPDIGVFTSRYSRDRLLALQADRAAAWATAPPPRTVVRLSREDQYLTEGIQHVRERNELWAVGDIGRAWLEDQILERYYRPVLDTPTHEGAAHRWPSPQRRDAEQRGAQRSSVPASGGSGFVSNAYPYPLFAWPKPVFWAVVLLLVVGGSVLGARSRRNGAPP
jgi:hypothetical protein